MSKRNEQISSLLPPILLHILILIKLIPESAFILIVTGRKIAEAFSHADTSLYNLFRSLHKSIGILGHAENILSSSRISAFQAYIDSKRMKITWKISCPDQLLKILHTRNMCNVIACKLE